MRDKRTNSHRGNDLKEILIKFRSNRKGWENKTFLKHTCEWTELYQTAATNNCQTEHKYLNLQQYKQERRQTAETSGPSTENGRIVFCGDGQSPPRAAVATLQSQAIKIKQKFL